MEKMKNTINTASAGNVENTAKAGQIRENLCAAWNGLGFLAITALYILPDVLKAVMLYAGKQSVAPLAAYLADLAGLGVCAGLGFLAIRSVNRKNTLFAFTNGVLPCMAALCLGKILVTIMSSWLGTPGLAVSLAAAGLIFGGSILLLGKTFGERIGSGKNSGQEECTESGEHTGREERSGHGALRTVCVLLGGALGYWITALTAGLFNRLTVGSSSWGRVMFLLLAVCIVRWLTMLPALYLACSGRDRESRERRPVVFGVSAAVLGLAAVMLFPGSVSFADRMAADYERRMAEACTNLQEGNILLAANEYKALERELEVWEDIRADGYISIGDSEAAENQVLAYLDACAAGSNRLGKMEKYYTAGYITDTDFCFLMLREYAKEETLSGEQENRRREILNGLAAARLYTGGLPEGEEIAEHSEDYEKLSEAVDSYGKYFEYVPLLSRVRLGEEYSSHGYLTGNTADLAREAIASALEKPEDFVWNYIALMLYNTQENQLATYNNPVEDIEKVAENFEKSFEKEFGQEAGQEERLKVKKLVMRAYLRTVDFDKCADYGLEALREFQDEALRDNTLYALFGAGRYQECLALAEAAERTTDPCPIYYAAAASLCLGDFDTSVEYALELAGEVENSEYPQTADELLYGYLSLLTVDMWNTRARYEELSPEQLARLKSDSLLKAYTEAFCAVYGSLGRSVSADVRAESTASALELADRVLALREGLCYPNYLKGVAYTQQEMWSEAAEAYRTALEMKGDDAMIWYALGMVYDRLEDYENEYKALTIAVGLNPWLDYYNEYESTGIHMWSYRERARVMLQRQHEKAQGVEE